MGVLLTIQNACVRIDLWRNKIAPYRFTNPALSALYCLWLYIER